MMIRNLILPVCLLLLASCSRQAYTETYSQETSEALHPGTQKAIVIENTNGDIEVYSSDSSGSILVNITRTISGESSDDARNHLGDIRAEKSSNADNITFRTVYGGDNNRNYSVKYKIFVPRIQPMDFSLETGNGNILISRISPQNLGVKIANGDIRTERIAVAKRMDLHVANGSIEADFSPVDGSLSEIESVNGSVTAAIEPNSNATIEAASTNGSITNHNLKLADYQKIQTLLKGRTGTGQSIVKLRSENGDISIRSNGRMAGDQSGR